MNEKYEIIIKENGEEIKRVSAKGFLLTVMYEDGIYNAAMVDKVSGLEIALLTIANEELLDKIWKDSGIESRALREAICKGAEKIKSVIEAEVVKE